ncbi:hypothetical protein HNQ80_002814 [Anaerosolibacter carboniphilus]|uniref:DUF3189 family protein n=1 Tax=Anaerosolibacter carboniphilus TaxID=1417629 RepID=A0A841KXI6_9FIRM|nr:DUF3189 family protein [Anaerosolibacter carboniphilus]MBB6216710.1 hypothetical protein [Anaerosolibacter carboniphilus]
MYVVYHDSSGTHSSVIAAAIHLNLLPADRIPSTSDLLNIPLFDGLERKDLGRLFFHGKDENNNQIYTIGCHRVPQLVSHALSSVFQMIDRNPEEILCVDTSPTINQWIRIGNWSSRQLGFVTLGRSLVVHGTFNAYPKIVSIVKNAKLKVAP